jgi:hypothetical protein
MRIGIRNATFLCTALALAFFSSAIRAHASAPATAQLSSSAAGAQHVTVRAGTARIVVGAAGMGNPTSPGTHSVRVTHGSETFAAPLAIR